MLEPRSRGAKPGGDNKIGTGRGTLRLRSKGPATVEEEVRPFVCFRHQTPNLKIKIQENQ